MTEPIKMPPDLKKDDWRHLKRYGYAPGEYTGTCHRCGETPTMDKRAITCRPCAETMYADEQNTAELRAERDALVDATGSGTVLEAIQIIRANKAELARLTTLRPHNEHKQGDRVLIWEKVLLHEDRWLFWNHGNRCPPGAYWTPIPPVKELK
jgi:hypothetical protein